jgi:hypothetical protein
MTTRRPIPHRHADPEITRLEGQTEAEMVAEVTSARDAGRLRVGGIDAERTVLVTMRMPASMVTALKAAAERYGVRGYQPLIRQWIDERLSGEQLVSARQLADALEPLQRLVDRAS